MCNLFFFLNMAQTADSSVICSIWSLSSFTSVATISISIMNTTEIEIITIIYDKKKNPENDE